MAEYPIVAGFRWASASCGIKRDGGLDLALLAADKPVPTAAMFTTNRVKAAPVLIAQERVEQGRAQAVIVNSGNANSCTGREGMNVARTMTMRTAAALGVYDALVLPASTGVIGVPLPVERVEHAIPGLVASLSPDGLDGFSRAILTTDRGPKVATGQVALGGANPATILAVAKGAGMIHPNMATTLVFVVTDAPMHSSFLQRALRTATEQTFHQITVDGDTSTNDTIVAMASGALGGDSLGGTGSEGRRFIESLSEVLGKVGRMIVADGEGAEHVVTIEVTGAPSEDAAQMVARAVATSLRVKTALYGKDPNWGRVLAAAGRAGVSFDPDKAEIYFNEVPVVRNGVGIGSSAEGHAREVMGQPDYTIRLKIGAGNAHAKCVTCDLGPEYVRINSRQKS